MNMSIFVCFNHADGAESKEPKKKTKGKRREATSKKLKAAGLKIKQLSISA